MRIQCIEQPQKGESTNNENILASVSEDTRAKDSSGVEFKNQVTPDAFDEENKTSDTVVKENIASTGQHESHKERSTSESSDY